jgi:hypothetical protein
VATNAELLVQCDAAITAVLNGHQSHSAFGRTFTKADLKQLWDMRKELEAKAASALSGGVRVQYVELM